jgi:DNA primase
MQVKVQNTWICCIFALKKVIPQHTVVSILEAARVEEVVGEFVSLKRRGSNLLGLCPFHQEKTPSFIVSPAKGIFKCFGCGKAGDSAKFIMEHEHLSYPEALRYLARKYQIEIEEREQTPEELASLNERERMFNLNSFAQQFFSDVLLKTEAGKAIGLSYFKERDFLESTITKFQLGYCPDQRDVFSNHARKHGYEADLLLKIGLSVGNEERLFDRFQGRVIFPIHSLTGKVLGFGGRILSNDKSKAKYLNSPESEIYEKSKTLYGIFFAKNAISRNDQCLLVEGYTDVISMHQAGIENVVASSGTSLTIDQIRLVKRYTKNITILFDGDPAGIKASLRGIDLILEEGMNVRVLLFPDGDDPDSYVKKHRTADVELFIKEQATDFISFKTGLLLKESQHDPILKAGLIKEIVHTISLIPEPIYRTVYVKECSRLLDMEEQTLMNELNKLLRQKFAAKSGVQLPEPAGEIQKPTTTTTGPESKPGYFQERELVKFLLLYGNHKLQQEAVDEDGFPVIQEESVAEFIVEDLKADNLAFDHPTHRKILEAFAHGVEQGEIPDEQFFVVHPEPDVSLLSIDLITSPYELHAWDKKQIYVKKEHEHLFKAINNNLLRYKEKVIDARILNLTEKIKTATDIEEQMALLNQKKRFDQKRKKINELLGIVITK